MKAAPYLAAAALAIGAGAAAWWWTAIPEVAVVKVSRGPVVDAVYASGSVEPTVMLPLAPRTSGRLAARLADEGDQVKKGQLLARLDDRDLASSIDEQAARLAYARSQEQRILQLAEKGFVARGEAERVRAEREAAAAGLERLRAQRGFSELIAPADGTIIRRDGEVGQYIGAGQALFVLACCAPLRVTAEVDEEDILRVRPGQAVVMRADAVPGVLFDGAVTELTPKGDPVNRSYRVRIALPAPGALRTGMTVDVNLIVARREQALLVPNQALRDQRVWVVSGQRVAARTVRTGSRSATHTEVLGGLEGNETLVAVPGKDMTEGQRVRIAAAGGG